MYIYIYRYDTTQNMLFFHYSHYLWVTYNPSMTGFTRLVIGAAFESGLKLDVMAWFPMFTRVRSSESGKDCKSPKDYDWNGKIKWSDTLTTTIAVDWRKAMFSWFLRWTWPLCPMCWFWCQGKTIKIWPNIFNIFSSYFWLTNSACAAKNISHPRIQQNMAQKALTKCMFFRPWRNWCMWNVSYHKLYQSSLLTNWILQKSGFNISKSSKVNYSSFSHCVTVSYWVILRVMFVIKQTSIIYITCRLHLKCGCSGFNNTGIN